MTLAQAIQKGLYGAPICDVKYMVYSEVAEFIGQKFKEATLAAESPGEAERLTLLYAAIVRHELKPSDAKKQG